MTVVNFTKKQNVLTGGSVIFGEAKSTDSRAIGVWTDGRTHGHNFGKCVFQNPLLQTKSIKKGAGKNTRAFRRARTESIPSLFKSKCENGARRNGERRNVDGGNDVTRAASLRGCSSRVALTKAHPYRAVCCCSSRAVSSTALIRPIPAKRKIQLSRENRRVGTRG